jgi:hypothetical protein
MQSSSQVSPSQMEFERVSPPASFLLTIISASHKTIPGTRDLDSVIADSAHRLFERTNRKNLLPQSMVAGRPLLKSQQLTEDYERKRQSAYPCLSANRVRLGWAQLSLVRKSPRASAKRVHFTIAIPKGLPHHAPCKATTTRQSHAQTVFSD